MFLCLLKCSCALQPPLEGGPATSEPGTPSEKTEEHPEESVAAPVEKSEPPTELPPAMEGEPTPTEEKKDKDEPVEGMQPA